MKKNPWYDYAIEDYKTIHTTKGKKLIKTVLFHAQQFIEKSIKGIIYDNKKTPTKTHDLVILAKEAEIDLSTFCLTTEELQFLNSVYIETRYPPDLGLLPNGEPSEKDEKYAIQIAEKFYKYMKDKF